MERKDLLIIAVLGGLIALLVYANYGPDGDSGDSGGDVGGNDGDNGDPGDNDDNGDNGDETPPLNTMDPVDAPCAAADMEFPENPTVTLHTSHGDITAEIFVERAPLTSLNFLCLAEAGTYDETVFHRIITDFMMQGGGSGGGHALYSDANGNIPDEFHPELLHDGAGVLAMANTGYPNTGARGFYITFQATDWLDSHDAEGNPKPCETRQPRGVSCHAVFGQVLEGLDAVQSVNAQASSASGAPQEAVTLDSVTLSYA